jgi:hypothetical protein
MASATSVPKPGTARALGPAMPNAASRSAMAPMAASWPDTPGRNPPIRRAASYAPSAAPSSRATVTTFV